jgi:hypothetical protein
MAEPQLHPAAEDLFDPATPFDADQWAMHGLMAAYFESARGDPQGRVEARVQALLARAGAFCPSPKLGSTGVPAGEAAGGTGVPAGGAVPLRLRTGPSLSRRAGIRALISHRRWALRGAGLAAAMIALAVVVPLAWRAAEREAFAAAATKVALTPVPEVQFELLEGDAVEKREEDLAKARETLAALRAEAERAAREGTPEEALKATHRVLMPWKDVYRPLRDLGRWDKALAEMHAELDYMEAGNNPTGAPLYSPDWHFVLLLDLGSTLEMMGDYAGARKAYLQSIDDREQRAERGRDQPPEFEREMYPQARRIETYVACVSPAYWRMSYLAALEGNLVEARHWHALAEACLRDYFVGVCEAAAASLGRESPPGPKSEPEAPARGPLSEPRPAGSGPSAVWHRRPGGEPSLLEAYNAAPREFREPQLGYSGPEQDALAHTYNGFLPAFGFVSKLREHLYHEARLCRMERNFAGAKQVLTAAARLPYDAVSDESRLMFSEPMELARIAIAERDYPTALVKIAEAEQNTGPIPLWDPNGNDVSKPPIAPLALAEADLLKGVALVGLNRAGPERATGRRLIGEGLRTLDLACAALPANACENLDQHLSAWKALGQHVRATDKSL